MKKEVIALSCAGLLVFGLTACVSQPEPSGSEKAFDAHRMIAELALLLPEGMVREAMSDPEGDDSGMPHGEGPQPGQIEITREEKLFLSGDQIVKLLPIMEDLEENPLPSPSRGKKVLADIDSVLTGAQKAKIEELRDAVQNRMKSALQHDNRAAHGFGGGPGQGPGQPPAGGPPGGQGGFGGSPSGRQHASKQRLQEELGAFIALLQEWQKQIEG